MFSHFNHRLTPQIQLNSLLRHFFETFLSICAKLKTKKNLRTRNCKKSVQTIATNYYYYCYYK